MHFVTYFTNGLLTSHGNSSVFNMVRRSISYINKPWFKQLLGCIQGKYFIDDQTEQIIYCPHNTIDFASYGCPYLPLYKILKDVNQEM